MFTAIIHREEYESWRCGERETQSPSRMEIVFDPAFEGFKEKLLAAAKSFKEDTILTDADHPEYEFLYNGVPIGEIYTGDFDFEGSDALCKQLWDLESEIDQDVRAYADDFRKQLAIKANEERLERERKEKAEEKERELRQLRLLSAKYGKEA